MTTPGLTQNRVTSILHMGFLAFLVIATVGSARADVALTVQPDSHVSVSAALDGGGDCQRDVQVGASGGSASCAVGAASARSVLSIQTPGGANGLPTIIINADMQATVPPIGGAAEAELVFETTLEITDRPVRYHMDFDPDFGGGQTGDSFGSVAFSGHGDLRVTAETVSDTLERDGILGIGEHPLTFDVLLRASADETVFASGVMRITLEPITEFKWNKPGAGTYDDEESWDPKGVPTHDSQFSDTAIFEPVNGVASSSFGVTGFAAKAGQWRISEVQVTFTGVADLFEPDGGGSSLLLGNNGLLELPANSSLAGLRAGVGVGFGDAALRVRGPRREL